MTGNGDFDGITDFFESIVKLSFTPAAGGKPASITAVDWWTWIRPLWDSQQWNWPFTHNKFNRPVTWNGRVFLPTYDAQVLVLGLA